MVESSHDFTPPAIYHDTSPTVTTPVVRYEDRNSSCSSNVLLVLRDLLAATYGEKAPLDTLASREPPRSNPHTIGITAPFIYLFIVNFIVNFHHFQGNGIGPVCLAFAPPRGVA